MKKALIIILLIVIAVVVIVGFLFINNNIKKSNVLNQYNLSETKYNELKLLTDKLIKKVNEENFKVMDIYYSKTGGMLVANVDKKEKSEPLTIAPYYYFITVTSDNTKILKATDEMALGTTTASSYYGGGFANARKDTSYKDYIYFENLEELQSIIKSK